MVDSELSIGIEPQISNEHKQLTVQIFSDIARIAQIDDPAIEKYRNPDYTVDCPVIEFRDNLLIRRYAFPNLGKLKTQQALTVVTFFGEQRKDVNVQTVKKIFDGDHLIVEEFVPGGMMYAYASYQLESGEWGDGAVFESPEAMFQWAQNPRHKELSRGVAPGFYTGVAIHTGELSNGIFKIDQLKIKQSRFISFSDTQNPALSGVSAAKVF